MNSMEDRLLAALDHKAATFTADPEARDHVRRRVRRTRTRNTVGVAAAVVVAGAAVTTGVLALPGLDDGAGRGHALAQSAGSPTHDPASWIRLHPPAGKVARTTPLGKEGPMTDVWFSAVEGRRALCWTWSPAPASGLQGSCSSSDTRPFEREFQVTAATGFDGSVSIGLAEDRARSVTAVLADGTRRPGSLLRAEGFPSKVWQVGAPGKVSITAVELADAHGTVIRQLNKTRIPAGPQCSDQKRPSAGAVLLTGGAPRISATWAGGCLNFWSGDRTRGIGDLRPGGSLTKAAQDGGSWWNDGPWWYGITGAATARVEIQFPGGRREAAMKTPDWKNEQVKLFVGTLPQGQAARGLTAIGYDSGGKILWRRTMP
ncbi:hypothetical protein [Actinomadura roseirufa]|uniref:hypothetical protein n=1 Tax=Actinomadura roseirufa TaxID=2094049 RepID=UPI0010416D14|nr:hypothetical protein [Actinomadura roseirufa]